VSNYCPYAALPVELDVFSLASRVLCCRLSGYRLTAEGEACDCEVADGGVGMDGSAKRIRAYKRKVYEPLKHTENDYSVEVLNSSV